MKKKIVCCLLSILLSCSFLCTVLSHLPVASASAATGYYENVKVLNMYSAASNSSGLIYTDNTNTVAVQIPIGTHLLVTQVSGNFGKACFQGIYGWIVLSDCKYIREFVTPTDATTAVIDISSYQEPNDLNWTKIKNAGVTGAIIRIGARLVRADGTGSLFADSNFLAHYKAAKAAGINVGFYFFSFALTREGVVEEAQFCLNLIKENQLEPELPIFFDLEDYNYIKPHYNGGEALNNMLVDAFCSTIENAGYYAGLYTNYNFITNVVSPSVLTNRAFWYADYRSSGYYEGRYDLWQYTAEGRVDGYSGYMDMNVCYRDYPTFIKQYGFNGFEGNYSIDSNKHWHTFGTPVLIQAATCTSTGLQSISCLTCSELVETNLIAKADHITTEVFIPNNHFNFNLNDTFTLQPSQYFDLTSESSTLSAYNSIQSTGGTLLRYCSDCLQIQSVRYFADSTSCSHTFDMQTAKYTANSTMNIRTGPATSFSTVTNNSGTPVYVAAGDQFDVIYSLGNWGYGIYNDQYGWINLTYSTWKSPTVYNNTTTVTDASCVTDGLQTATCLTCNEIAYKGTTPAVGHVAGQSVKIDGTCLTKGNYATSCQACGEVLKFVPADIGKHMYTRTVHTYPTDTEVGTATYTCSVCEDSREVALRSLHMFDVGGGTDGCDSGDARIALRCSVGLEEITYRNLHSLDVDYDDKLTAADARLLLRLSVDLEDEHELLFKYFEIK